MVEKRQQTTVTIDTDTGARLERLAKANGVSKKEFISLSLDYFEKYGINPAKQEMQKLIRRIDQVVAFQKVQERDFIRPAMSAVIDTEDKIRYYLSDINALVQLTKSVFDKLSKLSTTEEQRARGQENRAKEQQQANEELKKAVITLARYMDEKNKAGLIGKIFG